jgi:lipid-A-disaccharide synthase-like uncharacterized protein
MLNNILQWAGTACLLTMYVLMSFFTSMFPANLVAGMLGGAFYLAWSIRTRNKAQVLVNLSGILVCVAGLLKYYI